jgi:hypothetical protein
MEERKVAAIKYYPVPNNKTAEGFLRSGRVLQELCASVQSDCHPSS